VALIEALVLGILQGLTEFLPVSSSGHLVLLQHIFGWGRLPGDIVLTFDTTVHLGTLVAVVAVFWRDLLRIIAAWWRGLRHGKPLATPESRLAWWIVLGTVPAVLAGLLLEDTFARLFATPRAAGACLLLTALLLLLAELLGRRRRKLAEMTWLDGLLVGIGQAAAIAPGLSRSGTTMAIGMFRGLGREAAARFSFLLSVPIIAGTGLLQLAKLAMGDGWWDLGHGLAHQALSWTQQGTATPQQGYALALLAGFLAAAACGYGAIRLLLSYVRRRPLYPFAAYCAVIGLLAIVLV